MDRQRRRGAAQPGRLGMAGAAVGQDRPQRATHARGRSRSATNERARAHMTTLPAPTWAAWPRPRSSAEAAVWLTELPPAIYALARGAGALAVLSSDQG